LVVVRWAVLATATLATVFLMAALAQFGVVEANPGIPPGIFDDPTINIDSRRKNLSGNKHSHRS
jgi:hypothetical protein